MSEIAVAVPQADHLFGIGGGVPLRLIGCEMRQCQERFPSSFRFMSYLIFSSVLFVKHCSPQVVTQLGRFGLPGEQLKKGSDNATARSLLIRAKKSTYLGLTGKGLRALDGQANTLVEECLTGSPG